MIKKFSLMIAAMILLSCQKQPRESDVLYKSDAFTLFKNKVVQGDNLAEVVSPTHLKSNYRSPASTTFSNLIKFKFSINEKDNELAPGVDHWVIIDKDQTESNLIKFGETPQPTPENPGTYL
ncbi:MAG: hypothetical protein KA767_02345, partial [Saprospiraceae bacterium]|nr:hypothetical protein [Saprospiraceae bacterium]